VGQQHVDRLARHLDRRDPAEQPQGNVRRRRAETPSFARAILPRPQRIVSQAGMKDSAQYEPAHKVQVRAVDAWSTSSCAMGFCESPPTQGAAAVSDTVMFPERW
jgi:hypothetical protein